MDCLGEGCKMNLDLLPVSDISTLTLPKRFPEALQEALTKIDAHHKEMGLVYVCLFGSAARGEAEFGSDLDLLLLTNSESEKEVRLKVLEYEIGDDTSYVPVQVTVRRLCRFLDPESDVCGFNASIAPDLIVLRRYDDDSL